MGETQQPDYDVVAVGAGFAGMYLIHRMREAGRSVVVFESGDDVGGTWYWNRYPGARCDVQSVDYSYSWDPELDEEWVWSERYATQPEILRYANHVADKHDLRRDIRFGATVASAAWDDEASLWRLRTDGGDEVSCRYYVMATGCLSMPKTLDIDGADDFGGATYFTSRWPHEGVDLTGLRVGVIGTGSSGIQSIPVMAQQAVEMVVFQRTPNFSMPAHNGPVRPEKMAMIEGRRADYRDEARWSRAGVPAAPPELSVFQATPEEREVAFENGWAQGELFSLFGAYNDLLVDADANELVSEFIRNKIRSVVDDPETAESLCPTNHPAATKRPCLDSGYFETFNLPHVSLVDLRKDPIASITPTGIDTASRSFEFDVIVYATGFDAMTGAIVAVDVTGRDGVSLAEKWDDGPRTYLGLTVEGFPNFFAITGPGSPSVLSNMMVSIEQHVDLVTDTIVDLEDAGFEVIEATRTAEDGWVQHVNDCADITLYPRANSWYMGANVPGKPRVFLPYVGGVDAYRAACDEVRELGYLGFERRGADGADCNDGVIRRVQPDVAMVIQMMADLGAPPIESLSPDEARAFMAASAEMRPPGPEVGEIVDGTYPGADGSELEYRLYRPASPGPHPVVLYFHGGGWVLGSADSDDPMCRDLCVRTDALIVSCNYRHAPEARFPAAVDDGFAALQWVTDNVESLGGRPGPVAVAGWSAGGNIAAVACQTARDAGGPPIAGQVLITPVTDSDFDRPSYSENAEGFVLTRTLMDWFWDHYADAADRTDPRAAPLRGDLTGLPPALVVTCEFDPLRDEGSAYVAALQAAGVDAREAAFRGHVHTSVGGVGMFISSAPIREEIATALRSFVSDQVAVAD